jgi:hypothetical protein
MRLLGVSRVLGEAEGTPGEGVGEESMVRGKFKEGVAGHVLCCRLGGKVMHGRFPASVYSDVCFPASLWKKSSSRLVGRQRWLEEERREMDA